MDAARLTSGVVGEPAWLLAMRAGARAVYESSPAPDRVASLWRYSDPKDFEAPPGVAAAGAVLGGSAVFGAGDASRWDERLVRPLLGTLVPASFGRFEAGNLAAFAGGHLVYVPAGTAPPESSLTVGLGGGRPFVAGRSLVVVEERAEATVVLAFSGGGEAAALVSWVVEAFVGPGARLHLATVLDPGPGVRTLLTARTRVARDARFTQTIAAVGGREAKVDTGTVLAEPGAETGLVGFALGSGTQKFDHHTRHDHAAPNTRSDIDFKVVLAGRARSAYTGLIRIGGDAPGSEAYQENRNLLLTKSTKAESIPELEILTDDVRCTHGSATGPVDPELLYYLGSRGLTAPESTRLVVSGFVEPTLARLPEDLARPIRRTVERRLAVL